MTGHVIGYRIVFAFEVLNVKVKFLYMDFPSCDLLSKVSVDECEVLMIRL